MIDLGNKKDIKEVLERLGIKEGTPPANPIATFSVENILGGKTFYDKSLPVAFRKALEYATHGGIVVSMPELIAAKVKADKSHEFWQNGYDVHTEENIGIDRGGLYGEKESPVLIAVHGGGILTPDRIEQAYEEELISGSAKYTDQEFDNLLQGKLPDGSTIKIYTLEDLKKETPETRQYGVVMPYATAQSTNSGMHTKKAFIKNPLVIARTGGTENLEEYFEKAKNKDGKVGSWHPFNGRDPSQAQGRLLFLSGDDGLDGGGCLSDCGRFVGVSAGGA